jgi:hypothetical protein
VRRWRNGYSTLPLPSKTLHSQPPTKSHPNRVGAPTEILEHTPMTPVAGSSHHPPPLPIWSTS